MKIEEIVKPKISPLCFVLFMAMVMTITILSFRIRELNYIMTDYRIEREDVLILREKLINRLDSLAIEDKKTSHLRDNVEYYEKLMAAHFPDVILPPFVDKPNLGGDK